MLHIGAVVVFLSLVGYVSSWHNPEITRNACQGQWLNIDCPAAGQSINIRSANYGRYPGQNLCGSYGFVGCFAQNSLPAVRAECQGQGWCKVPVTQEFFGGYCRGSDKYLQVLYTCDYPPKSHKFVCQGGTLNVDCNEGHRIAIDDAIYGRVHGNAICPTDPYWLKNVHCVSSSGHDIVKRKCQGKRSCKVPATVGVFGDPCPGTSKYLFVRYSCVEDNRSSSSSSSSSSGRNSRSGSGSGSESRSGSGSGKGSGSRSGRRSGKGSGSRSGRVSGSRSGRVSGSGPGSGSRRVSGSGSDSGSRKTSGGRYDKPT